MSTHATASNRRHFLQATLTLPLLSVLPRAANAETDWASQFETALQAKPWLLGYKGIQQEVLQASVKAVGKWPAALTGTLYRNGPARHQIGNFRYQHWFDGDGMVQRFALADGNVTHTGRMVATNKYVAERAAGRALYAGFGTPPPEPRPVTSPDSINVANISVLPHHNRLLALWEAGSPWELDAQTLQTKGLYQFSDNTRGVPFSAHPRVEPDGTLWNFGYLSMANKLILWHIDAAGRLQKNALVDVEHMSMPHDFIVTAKHLVIMIPPLHFEPEGAGAFLDAHVWHPERPTRVLVVDKATFAERRWFELPAQWVFHFANGYEQDNVIRFDGARSADPKLMLHQFRDIMRGVESPADGATYTAYQLDLDSGKATEEVLINPRWSTEFPTIDPRVSGSRHDFAVMLGLSKLNPAMHGSLDSVITYRYNSRAMNTYRYPDHLIPEEHLFVPAPDSSVESEGWIVGTALNYRDAVTELNVFNAESVADGPVATAHLPYALPLGLHGKFVA